MITSTDRNNKGTVFKVVVVGNSEVGKTSLVSSLKQLRENKFDASKFDAIKYKPTVHMDFSKVQIPVYANAKKLLAESAESSGPGADPRRGIVEKVTNTGFGATEEEYAKLVLDLEIYDTCGTEMATRRRRNQMTPGQGSYAPEITSNFYRRADAVLFCFELDDSESLNDLTEWKKMVTREDEYNVSPSSSVKERCIYVVVGTKLDKITDGKKPQEESENTASSYDTLQEFKRDLENVTKEILDETKEDILEVQTTSARNGFNVSHLFEEVARRCFCVSMGWSTREDWCVSETRMRRMISLPEKMKEIAYEAATIPKLVPPEEKKNKKKENAKGEEGKTTIEVNLREISPEEKRIKPTCCN